ncbi:hypothetical protein BC830DRAFT_137428 [Chytriomyces sp. MP71]|nr:hypothetical protein BC830DRAFT_137428 [Chytriomyces sp. MP71]
MDLDRIARLSSESLVSLLHDLARLQPPTFPHASVYLRFTSADVPSDASTSPSQPLKPFPSPLADCVARELYARDICEHGGSVDLANARVKVWPKKQKGIEACLRFAATLIDPSRPVPDTEVLAAMNWFAAEAVVAKGCVIQMNPITIRRTLLDMGMIERNDDGSVYTRNKPPQELGLPGVKVPKF